MAATAMGSASGPPQDFSLVLGGPLFQLLRRAHLAGDALTLLRRRIVTISLFTWVPLLVLSAFAGQAVGGGLAVPFLRDFELHVRFLVALPLLVLAELVVHQRMQPVVRLFRERGLVTAPDMHRFERAIGAAFRLRNSLAAELTLVAVVYIVGIQIVWRHFIALNVATWYATPSPDGTRLSIAGIWYGYVSLPIFQFLLCRWYFRIFIWARFLFQVSRIELSLVPTHPDRLGGLGFLSGMVYAFTPLAAAHGAVLAGTFANRIFYTGASFRDFRVEVVTMVLFVMLLVFGPLVAFAPRLSAARRRGVVEYGTLAERYVREFDTKWLRGGAPEGEPLLGAADIQSLADLTNSLEVVRTMSSLPISKEAVVRLAVATVLPLLPLTLTIMPLEELVKRLFGMLF
jgi:hypothetical protein